MAAWIEYPTEQSISVAVRGLMGCTAIFAVTKEAVYVAHYWESESFSLNLRDSKGRVVMKRGRNRKLYPVSAPQEESDRAFQAYVIDALISGVAQMDSKPRNAPYRASDDPVQASFTDFVEKFDCSTVWLHVMTPRLEDAPDILYRTMVNRIPETINQILGEKDYPAAQLNEIPYIPADPEENAAEGPQLDDLERGVAIFQFQPFGDKDFTRETRQNRRQNIARLWVELNPVPWEQIWL